ncbi:Ankyrin-2 [Metarhizium brunneum]|uniref:Ankyrin-2 n=1 Tax=Metarhizium brunneum TaxID=500148 RepID=A0A7D5UPU3_9HYPO
MELANLPTELLLHIVKALDRDRDIYALCRTSRGFYNLTIDYLYRHNATAPNVERSAILWAAKHGRVLTAEKALLAGVDVNTPQAPSSTLPLVEAVRFGNAIMVWLLLAKGADPNVLHGKAGTVLHTAAAQWDMGTATALLEHGADVHAQRLDNGETPLHTAINSGAIMTGGATEMLSLLLDRGADVADADFVGATPLHCAAACGNIAAIHALLDAGAGAILSSRGAHRETPLHAAVRVRNEAAARVLMRRGADVQAPDARGKTVFWHAIKFGCPAILEMLLDKGGASPLHPNGNPALVQAARKGHAAVVKVLLAHGGGSDIKADPGLGESAMLAAVAKGHADVVQVLLDAGVYICTKDSVGNTLLVQAAFRGHDDVVDVLMRNGVALASSREWPARAGRPS